MSSAGGQASVADGTGEVRIGGAAAAAQISLLEPGDAVEVAGVVVADGIGRLIDVDPISMVTLSGGGQGSSIPASGGSGVPGSSSYSPAAAARFSGRSDASGVGVGLVLALALLAVLALGGVWVGLAGSAGSRLDALDSGDGVGRAAEGPPAANEEAPGQRPGIGRA
jgi:hypothetical protein